MMILILYGDHKKQDTKNKNRIGRCQRKNMIKQSKPSLSSHVKCVFDFYVLSIKTTRKNVKEKTKILGQMIKYVLSF